MIGPTSYRLIHMFHEEPEKKKGGTESEGYL